MSWKSRCRVGKSAKDLTVTPVSGIDEIPDDATPDQAFRISVDVVRVSSSSPRGRGRRAIS